MSKAITVECDDCGWTGAASDMARQLADVPKLGERIDVGGLVPAGECKCGSLCFAVYHRGYYDGDLGVARYDTGDQFRVEFRYMTPGPLGAWDVSIDAGTFRDAKAAQAFIDQRLADGAGSCWEYRVHEHHGRITT